MENKKEIAETEMEMGQEDAEGISYDAASVIGGVTVYKSYDKNGYSLWDCLLEAMGKL